MSVHPKEGGRGRRRLKLLAVAAAIGFVGRGGISASPVTLLALLLALFVLVFLVALAVSMVGDVTIDPESELAGFRSGFSEPAQVSNEAVLGSP